MTQSYVGYRRAALTGGRMHPRFLNSTSTYIQVLQQIDLRLQYRAQLWFVMCFGLNKVVSDHDFAKITLGDCA